MLCDKLGSHASFISDFFKPEIYAPCLCKHCGSWFVTLVATPELDATILFDAVSCDMVRGRSFSTSRCERTHSCR